MKVKQIAASVLSLLLISGTVIYPQASVLSKVIGNTEITAHAYSSSSKKNYNGFEYYEHSTGSENQARIVGYTGNAVNLTIPATINGRVVVIDGDAFAGCTTLKNVIVSEGITTICNYAFEDCTNLETITLPSTLENILPNSFEGCNKLRFLGPGVPVVVRIMSSLMLLDFGHSYNQNMTDLQKYQVMRDVAIKLHNRLTYDTSAPNEGDAASVLNTLKATCGGYSRVYYHLGLAAGLTANEIKVVGDFHCHAWNYLKISGKWYNMDITNSIYFKSDADYAKSMFGNTNTSDAYHTYSKWYNVEDVYGNGTAAGQSLASMGLSSASFRGDVNGDGVVDAFDLALLRRYIINTQTSIILPAADWNSDGVIDAKDVSALQNFILGA